MKNITNNKKFFALGEVFKLSRLQGIYVCFVILALVGTFIFSPNKAKAYPLHPFPSPTQIPSSAVWDPVTGFNPYAVYCGAATPRSPAIATWVSGSGNYASTTTTVPYGTTSVPLKFHIATTSCNHTVDVVVSSLTSGAYSTEPGTSVGTYSPNPLDVWSPHGRPFPPGSGDPGRFTQSDTNNFNFNKPSGFKTSKTYTLYVKIRALNRWGNNTFQCSANQVIVSGPNYAACPEEFRVHYLTVNVYPNVTVSGRVFNINNPSQGYSGVRITTCGVSGTTLSTLTNSNGDYTFSYPAEVGHCLRIDPSTYPGGITGAPKVRPWNIRYGSGAGGAPSCPGRTTPITGYCNGVATYEWQLAGRDCYLNFTYCGVGKIGNNNNYLNFDRSTDGGFDFVFLGANPGGETPPEIDITPQCSLRNVRIGVRDLNGGPFGVEARIYNGAPTSYSALSPATQNAASNEWKYWNIPLDPLYANTTSWTIEARSRGYAPPGFTLGGWVTELKNMAPCSGGASSYSALPIPNLPNFNSENPTSGTFPGSYDINTAPPTTINSIVRLVRRYYVKYANGNPDTNFGGTPSSIPLSAGEKTNGNHALATPTIAGVPPVNAGDKICQEMSLSPDNGSIDISTGIITSGGASTIVTECITVVNRPYFSVYGGDVIAGGSIDDGSGCSATASSPIASFLNSTTNSGSGSQLAAFATNHIAGFASAKLRSPPVTSPNPDNGLDFANTVAGSPGTFGLNNCLTGYEMDTTKPAPPGGAITSWGSAGVPVQYYHNGDYTINNGAGGILPGRRIVLYIKGNLTINNTGGGIFYKTTSNWDTPDDIPSLTVIVAGNIYIDKGVDVLDGVYVAYPNSGIGGNIYTCTNGSNRYTSLSDDLYNECNNKLTVHGSLIAKDIKWLRTKNSLRDSNSSEQPYPLFGPFGTKAAEEVLSDPELYLSKPALPKLSETGGGTQFDAITSLPPVL